MSPSVRWAFAVVFFLAGLPAVAWAASPSPSPVPSATPSIAPVTVTAQQVTLYGDRSLLLVTGGVAVHAGDLQVTATRGMYDMRADRFFFSGDVGVKEHGVTTTGQGYYYEATLQRGRFEAVPTIPSLSITEATVVAQQAEIHPAHSILFSNCQVRTGSILTPVATYEYPIMPRNAKNFGNSPVPSAALEYPVIVGSGRDGYAFARARYDRYNGGPGAGLEEHFASSRRGYLVLAQTLDVDGGRLDLSAFSRINGTLTQTLTATSLTGEKTFLYSLAASGRLGYASLSTAQFNQLRTDDLYTTTNPKPLWKLGQLREQLDLAHDVHPSDYAGAQDVRVTPGLHFDSASVRFGRQTLTSSADLGEAFYDYGRVTLSSDVSFWDTYLVNRFLQFSSGTTFSHVAPPFPSTYRTYVVGTTWRASPAFNFVSSLTYTHDYGQYLGIGRPEFAAAFDVRFRRRNGQGIEIGTIVPFGAGNLYHAGAFNFRFFK